jgi:hypothetical protein
MSTWRVWHDNQEETDAEAIVVRWREKYGDMFRFNVSRSGLHPGKFQVAA